MTWAITNFNFDSPGAVQEWYELTAEERLRQNRASEAIQNYLKTVKHKTWWLILTWPTTKQ